MLDSSPPIPLHSALSAASVLAGGTNKAKQKSEKNVTQVLKSRLSEFDASLGDSSPLRDRGDLNTYLARLDDRQTEESTGDVALWVLTQIEARIGPEDPNGAPAIGVRDMATLRTLIAVVFRYALLPRLQRVMSFWVASAPSPAVEQQKTATKIVQIDETENIKDEYTTLLKTTRQLLAFVSVRPPSHTGYVVATQHITALLKACIALAWGPESTAADMQQQVQQLLSIVPSSQALASLGSIVPQFALTTLRAATHRLLTQQLLRPEGVRGLCSAILGDADAGIENVPLAKLENIARVVSAVPSDMTPNDYYGIIVPRVLAILAPPPDSGGNSSSSATPTTPAPESHKRAAAFTLSRMLGRAPDITLETLSPTLRSPFLSASTSTSPTSAIATLQTIFAHSDPSPTLPAHLLSPIIAPLFGLQHHVERVVRTADPALKEAVKGLVRIWGRTVDGERAVSDWWAILNAGAGWGEREVGVEMRWEVVGEDARIVVGSAPQPLALFNNLDLDALANGESTQALGLSPDPEYVVSVLKSFDRKGVASSLFVRALDEYQALNASEGADPMRTLLFLRLVMTMVEELGSTVLTDPQHVLAFVSHALRSGQEDTTVSESDPTAGTTASGLSLEKLRIIDPAVSDSGEDSDDEGDDDYMETALNLLLATLEANPTLGPTNTPLLQVIAADIERLTLHDSDSVRSLAREARLVLTARSASTSTSTSPSSTESTPKATAQETYQQALKLLQDPVLPVRAHGLVLLRELLTSSSSSVDGALVPAILSIFMQSVQEDDSYIFLNAVKGLVAMVDKFGREILKGLLDAYCGDLLDGGGGMAKADLDKRVRIGEAMSQSIRRCGDALGAYVDMLVPPLFHVVRNRDLPTTLRTSALSLLAQCTSTSGVAMVPWSADLCAGLVELVQIEGVTATAPPSNAKSKARSPAEEDKQDPEITSRAHERELEPLDRAPLSKDPKLAPFRRSALHLLATTIRSAIDTEHENVGGIKMPRMQSGEKTGEVLPPEVVKRMRIVLAYARATDADDVVRVMAGEVLELVDVLEVVRFSSG